MVRKVEVVQYDPTWPMMYQKEVDRISPRICDVVSAFHHMGSTAVPGLAAKPTIDILAVTISLVELDKKEAIMRSLGYHVMGEYGIPGRRYYRKLSGEVHLFHIHTFKAGNPEIQRHLNFRDYLRINSTVREAYQELKLKLAQEFTFNTPSYTAGKSAFISMVDREAAQWRDSLDV